MPELRWPALPTVGMVAASALFAQLPTHKPVQTQSPSSFSLTVKDGADVVEISNIAFEMTSELVPGRPNQRLLLRKTERSKQVLGDMGMEAQTTLEAWPLGVDIKQKPLYTIKAGGLSGQTVDEALFVISRGVEEVEWWSVYKLGTGEHLFDTYVPLVRYSISRQELTLRYVGLEVPPDDASDKRLAEPHVVGVLTYAAAEKVKREALITCDDPKQARLLRAYFDTTRTVSLIEGTPPRGVKIYFSQNAPSSPGTIALTIPIANDDLDLAHAQLPPKLHIAAWRR